MIKIFIIMTFCWTITDPFEVNGSPRKRTPKTMVATTPSTTSSTPSMTPLSNNCSQDGYFLEPSDPSKYILCTNGTGYLLQCKFHKIFNNNTCVDEPEPSPPDFKCQNNGYFKDPKDPQKYFICVREKRHWMSCVDNLEFSEKHNQCMEPKVTTTTTTRHPTSGETPNPSEHCEDGQLLEDPNDLSKYFACIDGVKQIRDCCCSLVWNNTVQRCWFPNEEVPTAGPTQGQINCTLVRFATFADPSNPHNYFECSEYIKYSRSCSPGTVYDLRSSNCNFPPNSKSYYL